ncbi:SDR family oxidoreductase [Nocardia sp. NPDC058658]|uniref:SDR family oxidoreductase n=1 Tax=Nocardia sp. NPDC058658 TaxID=3346580 RepID=UPI00365848C5
MAILVTGATGNIGRMVVDQLLACGASDVRALTIDPERAALPAEVEVVEGHLGRVGSAAFAGVDRMYLAPSPGNVAEVLEVARAAGVRHVVDLSGEPESWWGSVCDAVEGSGLEWTHLWPADFMENTLSWSRQIRETGVIREPHADTATAPIAMKDIAAVAATALLNDGHVGRAHSLAGPEILTRAELVAHIADALDRDITFRTSTREETITALQPSMGDNTTWYVDNVLIDFAPPPQSLPITSVEDITGHPATTFDDWARANAARFLTD